MPQRDRIDDIAQARRPPRQAKGQGAKPGVYGVEPFVATEAQRAHVMTLVAAGFTQESISVVTQIPLTTLQDHFPFELREGKTIVDAKILGGIVSDAIAGDKTMRIFYARSRAGWNQYGPAPDSSASAMFSISIGSGHKSSESASEIKVSVIPRTIDHEEEP